ncbi:MAG: HNH endonuclease family protein, partial [Flavobacteriales bacterium]
LGVRLTTAELLKNYFFKRDEIESYNKYWKQVFEKDDDTKIYWDREITTGRLRRTFIDLFFYSYLQIKIQEPELKVNTEDKIEFSKVENLFESYKRFIRDYKLDKTKILDELKEYADLFKENFDYDIVNNELSSESGIERINAIIFGLDTSTLIPYSLYILKNVKDETQRNELFAFIESYVMRRMVVKATTKNYNQLFTDRLISNKILSKQHFVEYLEGRNDKVNYLPNDTELKQGFETSILINKQTAGIIYLIESKIRNRHKQATQLLGISKYSLEHLMPKKWENKWNSVPTKEAKDYRNFKLKTLGNLAIITQSLNASIRDSNWPTKKRGSGNKEGLKHYSGGIETLAPYLDLNDWNETEIENRAEFLLEKAKEIWTAETMPVANNV